MNTDLIGSIELTASAAIVIAALSIGCGSNPLMRFRIAVGLGVWFIIVVILAATRALYYEHGLGTPGLGLAVALPIAIFCLTVGRVQSLRDAFHRVPFWLLVGRAHGPPARREFYHSLRGRSFARAVRSGRRLGRHLCRSNRCPSRVACLSADRKCSDACLDLEHHWNRGSDRRDRIGSNVLAWPAAVDFRGT